MAEFNTGINRNEPAYRIEGERPIPVKSVLAFADVLGYGAKVREAAKIGKTSDFLVDFRQALYAATNLLGPGFPYYAFNFTDTVIIGWPIPDDIEVPLCDTCLELCAFQLTMSQYGYFIRGGIAVGEAYLDKYVQSGEVLLEAYETESSIAVYPRIVLSETAVKEVERCCGFYCDANDCPLNNLFLVDADGLVFVNYLAYIFEMFDIETCLQDIIDQFEMHAREIEQNLLKEHPPHIRRKFQWAARYHDYVYDCVKDLLGYDVAISVDYDKERFVPPRRLLEVFPNWLG